MTQERDEDKSSDLRRRAEDVLRAASKSSATSDRLDELAPEDIRRLAHELRVHQVELEAQNAELRLAEEVLNASRDRYVELYDFAPVGYFTLDENGGILEANLTGARLVGAQRGALLGQPFARFVAEEDRDPFHVYHRQLGQAGARPDVEIRMSRGDGVPLYAQLQGAAVRAGDEPPGRCRLAVSDITERKRKEALELARERLELALRGADLGMYDLNVQTGAVFADRRYLEMIGYAPGELEVTSDSWLTLVHPDDRPAALSGLQGYLDGTLSAEEVEYRLRHKSGAWVWILDRSRVVSRDEQGRALRVIGTHLDITAHRRAQEQLRYQASLIDNVAEAVIGLDLQLTVVSWNPAAETIYGWRAEEVMGRPLDEFVQTEYRDRNGEEARRRLFEAGYWTGEVVQRRRDGAIIHVQSSISLIKDAQGRPTGMVGINRDFTAQKRAAEELRRAQELLTAVIDNTPALIFVMSVDGRYLMVNQAWTEALGLSREQAIGRLPDELFSAEAARQFDETTEWVVQKDAALPYEVVLEGSGGRRSMYVVKFPLHDDAGRVEAVGGISFDVTERKRAEEALQQSEERLRELTVSLHAALEEERTYIAREIHDEFGQMLTALKMDVASLSRQLPAERSDWQGKTARMCDQIDTALDMVRRVATELRPGVLDDLGLAAAIEWQAQEFVERTGIDCDLYLSEANGPLERDLATALFRIFQEALTNVARHAQATEVRVTLAETPGELALIVQDNGRGISAHEAADPRSLGLIGMAERVRPWGARVTVVGEAGRGTTVTVRVPRPHEGGQP